MCLCIRGTVGSDRRIGYGSNTQWRSTWPIMARTREYFSLFSLYVRDVLLYVYYNALYVFGSLGTLSSLYNKVRPFAKEEKKEEIDPSITTIRYFIYLLFLFYFVFVKFSRVPMSLQLYLLLWKVKKYCRTLVGNKIKLRIELRFQAFKSINNMDSILSLSPFLYIFSCDFALTFYLDKQQTYAVALWFI